MTEHPFNNDSTPAERLQVHKDTLHTRAISEANEGGGRFSAHEKSTVVGASPIPAYPQGPAWCADPTGVEPPTGYAINDAPVVGEPHEVEQSIRQLGATGLTSGQPDGGDARSGRGVTNLSSRAVKTRASPPPFTDDEPPEAA